jgi:hypothetical protein
VLNHIGEIILGVLVSAFFTLLWLRFNDVDKKIDRMDDRTDKRLAAIDNRLDLIQKDQTQFYGITQKLEGRVDEISSRVK